MKIHEKSSGGAVPFVQPSVGGDALPMGWCVRGDRPPPGACHGGDAQERRGVDRACNAGRGGELNAPTPLQRRLRKEDSGIKGRTSVGAMAGRDGKAAQVNEADPDDGQVSRPRGDAG